MRLQILCATMHQTDFKKIEEMNIQTDVVFANQADRTSYEEKVFENKTAKMITTKTRGVSVNRNLGWFYTDADIVLFTDDDQVFVDGYESIVTDEFKKHPNAEAIKFNCLSTNPNRQMAFKGTKKFKRMHKIEMMSAGIHALAVRKDIIEKNNITFRNDIGPGRKIYCGEDSIFYDDLFKSKVKIYSSPTLLSYIKQEDSSWFKGFTDQYFESVGYLYQTLYGILTPLFILRKIIKTKKETKDYTPKKIFELMQKGANEAKR